MKVRKKKSDYQKAKAAHWKAFSRWIRLRDCLLTTGTIEHGRCVTCGKVLPFEKLQAGHFIPGRSAGILFEEQGVHAQCYGCNVPGRGRLPQYQLFMLKTYGQEVIDDLFDKSRRPHKITVDEHREETKRLNRVVKTIEDEG